MGGKGVMGSVGGGHGIPTAATTDPVLGVNTEAVWASSRGDSAGNGTTLSPEPEPPAPAPANARCAANAAANGERGGVAAAAERGSNE